MGSPIHGHSFYGKIVQQGEDLLGIRAFWGLRNLGKLSILEIENSRIDVHMNEIRRRIQVLGDLYQFFCKTTSNCRLIGASTKKIIAGAKLPKS